MLFLLVSFSQISASYELTGIFQKASTSSSSTFVHRFCCLRNKTTKTAVVAACWAMVMDGLEGSGKVLQSSLRLRLAKLPLPGRAQGHRMTQNVHRMTQWHKIPPLYGSPACRGVFPPTTSPQKCQHQSPWLWASCFLWQFQLREHAPSHTNDSEDIVPKDLLLSSVRAS